jgi:hypothetical protein
LTSESELEPDGSTIIYTKYGPVLFKLKSVQCFPGCCSHKWTGEQDCIFRSSSHIAAGYEIGWDFVDHVKNSKYSFSAYCNHMTTTYKRYDLGSRNFMDCKTFINWFFSWASHQVVEFRQPCTWCGWSPKLLAGDGTHVGIRVPNVSIDPIDQPGQNETIIAPHRINDRCFLSGKSKTEIRRHLAYLSKKILGKLKNEEIISEEMETTLTFSLFSNLPTYSKPLFQAFMSQKLDHEELMNTAKIFLVLSYEAPLISLLPLELAQKMEETVTEECLPSISSVTPELAMFLSVFLKSRRRDIAITFLTGMACHINCIHVDDIPPEEPSAIPNSYNPPKNGRAYYFRPDGFQVRQTRLFDIDHLPSSHDSGGRSCQKFYPKVSTKGTAFLFLWFCPLHGHCYGGHIISGGEGRKDPSASIYQFILAWRRRLAWCFMNFLVVYRNTLLTESLDFGMIQDFIMIFFMAFPIGVHLL